MKLMSPDELKAARRQKILDDYGASLEACEHYLVHHDPLGANPRHKLQWKWSSPPGSPAIVWAGGDYVLDSLLLSEPPRLPSHRPPTPEEFIFSIPLVCVLQLSYGITSDWLSEEDWLMHVAAIAWKFRNRGRKHIEYMCRTSNTSGAMHMHPMVGSTPLKASHVLAGGLKEFLATPPFRFISWAVDELKELDRATWTHEFWGSVMGCVQCGTSVPPALSAHAVWSMDTWRLANLVSIRTMRKCVPCFTIGGSLA